jgi:hypothetical protein
VFNERFGEIGQAVLGVVAEHLGRPIVAGRINQPGEFVVGFPARPHRLRTDRGNTCYEGQKHGDTSPLQAFINKKHQLPASHLVDHTRINVD